MKKTIFLAVISLLLLQSGSVFAAVIDSITEDIETGNIVIKGDIKAKGTVSVEVLKAGVSAEEFKNTDDDEQSGKIYNLFSKVTPDGRYSVTVPMKGAEENGVYTVSVSHKDAEMPERREFSWFKTEEIQSVFGEFKNTQNASEVGEILTNGEKTKRLGISDTIVDNLSDKGLSAVSETLFSKKSEIPDVNTLREEFIKAASPMAVASAKDTKSCIEALETAIEGIGLTDNEDYLKFRKGSEKYRTSVAKRLMGSDIASASDLTARLGEAVFLADLENSSSVGDVNDIIKNNLSFLPRSGSLYRAERNTYSYDRALAGKSFDSASDADNALYDLIRKGSSSSPSSNGGGGGSSGGGGYTDPSGAVITLPVQTDAGKENIFDDLDTAEWARAAIEELARKNIVSGRGDKKFCPQDNVTREEFVKMAVGSFGIEADGDVPFADVKKNEWYFGYIRSAYNTGLVKGISDDLFGTGQNITRQDMAVLIYRFMTYKNIELNEAPVGFDDKIEISDYAKEAVGSLREAGIISGMENNMFRPKEKCTRAQVAYIIYKAMKYAGIM